MEVTWGLVFDFCLFEMGGAKKSNMCKKSMLLMHMYMHIMFYYHHDLVCDTLCLRCLPFLMVKPCEASKTPIWLSLRWFDIPLERPSNHGRIQLLKMILD